NTDAHRNPERRVVVDSPGAPAERNRGEVVVIERSVAEFAHRAVIVSLLFSGGASQMRLDAGHSGTRSHHQPLSTRSCERWRAILPGSDRRGDQVWPPFGPAARLSA